MAIPNNNKPLAACHNAVVVAATGNTRSASRTPPTNMCGILSSPQLPSPLSPFLTTPLFSSLLAHDP